MNCSKLSAKKSNKVNLFFLIFSIFIVFALMFVLNYYTPLYFDDFRYIYSWDTYEKISNVYQIFPSMKAHYQTMNGRIPVHFLAQLFLLIPPIAFDIVNSAAFALFIFVICYFSVGSLKDISAPKYLLSFALIWFFTPSFGESFLWLTGSTNYLFGPLIAISFLFPYIKTFKNGFKIKNIFLTVVFSFLYFVWGILAGWTNENISLCIIIAQILFVIIALLSKEKLQVWMVSGIIGNIIGTTILFSSPSYSERSSIWSGSFNISSMIHDWVLNISSFFNDSFVLIILIIIFTVISLVKLKKDSYIKFLKLNAVSIVFLLTSVAYSISPIACDYFPGRAWTACVAMLCVVFLSMFFDCENKRFKRIETFLVTAICLAVFVWGPYINTVLDLKQVDYAFNERESLIEQYHQAGKTEIKLKPIRSNNTYSCYSSGGDIAEDYWMNGVLEKYYKTRIIVDD